MTEIIDQNTVVALAPIAKFVNEDGRSAMVTLEYPVEFDGTLITEVRVGRVTGGQMDAYMNAVVAGENVLPPVIDCPMPVWDAMDADDQFAIDQAARPFMPMRLKRMMASPAAQALAEKED